MDINLRHIAEGAAREVGLLKSALGNYKLNLPPIFQQWIVLEVITDPFSFTQQKLRDLESQYGPIRNRNLTLGGRILPRNTIVAHPPKNAFNPEGRPAFLYPFLPSSIALPARPGEHIWVMFEIIQPENQSTDVLSERGYWVCSVVQEGHVEDSNYSHQSRSDDVDFLIANDDIKNGELREGGATARQKSKGIKPTYHFKNGRYVAEERIFKVELGDLYINGKTPTGDEYRDILQNSEGSKNSVYESVPRFKKRPGDIALEGSNNSLIVLGRDRTGPLSDDQSNKKAAGSIDLVVGRGQTPKTGGNVVVNDLKNEELAKDGASLVPNEGDPDFKADKSRIYVSQQTEVDKNFGISDYNDQNFDDVVDTFEGDPGIIIKSDKIRLIARSDLQIIVTNNVKEAEDDPKKFASITVKSNGDIVFKPSDMGYIKLGGDDADRGIVCSAFPVTKTNGGIEGGHLLTSMGGLFAGATFPTPECNQPLPTPGPTAGTFANKVLIK